MKNIALASILLASSIALGQAYNPLPSNGNSSGFSGNLSGDVTGTQSATVVSTVGTSTAANVHSAEVAANAAASANTASTIVKRDSSGNFSAGTITGTLSGNASGLSSTLGIASGGTGQTSANNAFNALAPSQSSNSGKFLTTNGTNTSWSTVSSVGGVATVGAFSGRPAAGTGGSLFIGTDSPVAMWIDDGTAWHPIVYGVYGVQPKAASNFTAFNRVGGTVPTLADRNGALHYALGTDSLGALLTAGFYESLSSSTAHVEGAIALTGSMQSGINGSDYYGGGLIMRESGSGKFAFIDWFVNNTVGNAPTMAIDCAYYASTTSRTSSYVIALPVTNAPIILRLARSGSNILWQTSTDNQNWTTVRTVATTTVFTTAPDQVGFAATDFINTDTVEFDVLHYNSGS